MLIISGAFSTAASPAAEHRIDTSTCVADPEAHFTSRDGLPAYSFLFSIANGVRNGMHSFTPAVVSRPRAGALARVWLEARVSRKPAAELRRST